jgi:hypothetical protein
MLERDSQRNSNQLLGRKQTSDNVHQYVHADASESCLACSLDPMRLRVCFAVLETAETLPGRPLTRFVCMTLVVVR